MSVLKWQRGENDWVTLYGTVLKNRLRRDKNLADLENTAEAKKNLGLIGDVSDHYHDSRYLPMIQRVANDLSRETEERKVWQENFDQEIRASIDSQVENVIQQYGTSINMEAVKRADEDAKTRQTIQNNMDEINKKFTAADKKHEQIRKDAKSYVEDERSEREAALLQAAADRDACDDKVKELIKQEKVDRENADAAEISKRDDAIEKKAVELKSLISEEASSRSLEISQESLKLSNAIAQEASRRSQDVTSLQKTDTELTNLISQKYTDLKKYIDSLFKEMYVGTIAPDNPVNNQTIWFYTGEGQESIRVFKDNKWVTFGASYL